MAAVPFGTAGHIEDFQIIYDENINIQRMLTRENQGGCKAMQLESELWDKECEISAKAVKHNATGTYI